ncbi:carotenoid oxygenase family protein [Streptomyces griseorubiginosus]|uniref:carotenoid oxygenase family protein n=1 Tax=Streptomyces griseorubiginosus TaxID=67304 RepID=UPI0033E5763C
MGTPIPPPIPTTAPPADVQEPQERSQFPDTRIFKGFYAPSRIEADVYDLEIEGRIPPELSGAFYRNSADTQYAPRFADDNYINGDGMIHMVRFDHGHADLRTRYVRTQRFLLERQARKALFGAYRNPYTADPSVRAVDDGNANTSVVWHAGRLLALKEAALPYELDPVTLETKGVFDFDGQIPGRTFTAHPKLDPRTGEMIAFAYNTSGRPDKEIHLYEISAEGKVTRTQSFEVPYSAMVHDWLVTREHFVFVLSPMIADAERMKTEAQYFMWDPERSTHVAVVPREEGVSGIRWFSSDLVMETHTVNAWSSGDTLVADHFVTTSGWYSQFPKTTVGPLREAPSFLHRWTFDLTAGAAHWDDARDTYASEKLVEVPGEMPRVDPRVLMERNRHAWLGAVQPNEPLCEWGPMGPPFNSIVHRDDHTGEQTYWAPGEQAACEEPVFVPKSAEAGEGEGYLLVMVGRRDQNRNDLVVLDALDVAAGPVATVKIPFRLRDGFHGTWVPGTELER